MASVSPQPSPNGSSPYGFDSSAETEESWQYIDYAAGSTPSSIGFLSDPASGSLNSFTVIRHVPGNTPSPSITSASPLLLGEMDQSVFFPSNTAFTLPTDQPSPDIFANTTAPPTTDGGFGQVSGFMTPQQYLFQQQDPSQIPSQELNELSPFMTTFQSDLFPVASENQSQFPQVDLNIPMPFQADANVPPWNPTNPRGTETGMFIMDDFSGSSPKSVNSHTSSSPSASSGRSRSPTDQIRKVKTGKIERKKTEQSGKFVIVTPTSISAHAGRPNPFECFEAMRTSQRGRKGPLANAVKENALQVRRLGACFCCHSRKVKCDKERPCKSCKKLMIQVPQVVCWQFADFIPILFPDFIRGHFRKEEMTKFIGDHVEGFVLRGVEQTCSVELFSGPLFSTVLAVEAKFFTPKGVEAVQHWHLNTGQNRIKLRAENSAAIGLEFKDSSEREMLKKRAKKYVKDLVDEPAFPEQVTDSFMHTLLPRRIIQVVKRYAEESDSPMVKRALSIYGMHYIMTRHLCLTVGCLDSLQATGMMPINANAYTPRLLARQIKSVIDEMMMRETQQLFEHFSKSLKPKSRREWAPCLASFLVLCLFMEAIETAADVFVVTQNEIGIREGSRFQYERSVALNTCKEVENMPFKQFAYQFHQVYQTHTKEANAKSFNPLLDDSFIEQGELDQPAINLVRELREFFYGDLCKYSPPHKITPPSR
ncbi:hypothetical protein BGZ63DRAFT_106574 [Mariannaea sp. PMI_226]|nr:hypothetical protein BGZ63DRAFT_106574 [Mariannaea sp. PMI_226]